MAELQELAMEAADEGIGPDLWPHTHGQLSELRGGLTDLSVRVDPGDGDDRPARGPAGARPGQHLLPALVAGGSNVSHAQAHLLATEGYSFVTFRMAYDT